MEKKTLHGIEIYKGDDGLWRDAEGDIFALADDAASSDDVVRCGVGVLSLPEDSWATDGCRNHDAVYSTPAYQASNPRSRADRVLRDQLLLVAGRNPFKRAAAYAMYYAARLFGAAFWENGSTRGL